MLEHEDPPGAGRCQAIGEAAIKWHRPSGLALVAGLMWAHGSWADGGGGNKAYCRF